MMGVSPTGGSDFTAGRLATGAETIGDSRFSRDDSGARVQFRSFGGRAAGMKLPFFLDIFSGGRRRMIQPQKFQFQPVHAPGEILDAVWSDGPRDEPDARHDGQADDQQKSEKFIHNRVLSGRPCRLAARSWFYQSNFHNPTLHQTGASA